MKKQNEVVCNELISVLVPMYNTEATIARCVKSILNQTYANLEIVLLNDGSKDKTYEIAKTFADTDKRIKLLTKQNEGNISKTRNYLLNNFSGDYVVWVDSDDVLHKRYVEKLYSVIKDNDADCGICGYSLKLSNSRLFKKFFPKVKVFKEDEMYPSVILNHKIGFMLWNKIYKSELLKGLQFNEEVKFGEDFDFVLQYLKKCKKLAYVNEKLYKYISRPTSETRQNFSAKKLSFITYLQNLEATETNPVIKEVVATWLAFSANTILYLAKKGKYDDIKELTHLYELTHKHKETFNKNKKVGFLYKFVMFIGLNTWARKQPKKK